MFNIGDEVTVDQDYPVTKVGDIGTITAITGNICRVEFHTMAREEYTGYVFNFSIGNLVHIKDCQPRKTAVERKIAAIYARKYRKTGAEWMEKMNVQP